MSKRSVRINVTALQLGALRREVFCNQRLSGEQRRSAIRKVIPLPTDGSRINLYCDGGFLGTV